MEGSALGVAVSGIGCELDIAAFDTGVAVEVVTPNVSPAPSQSELVRRGVWT